MARAWFSPSTLPLRRLKPCSREWPLLKMAPAQAPPSLAEAVLLLLLLSQALLLPVALAVALVLLPAKEPLVLTAHASVLLPAVLVLSLMLKPKVSVPLAEWEVSIYKSPSVLDIPSC